MQLGNSGQEKVLGAFRSASFMSKNVMDPIWGVECILSVKSKINFEGEVSFESRENPYSLRSILCLSYDNV